MTNPISTKIWKALLQTLKEPTTVSMLEAKGFKIDWPAIHEVSTEVILDGVD
jgi:hypothetical protein